LTDVELQTRELQLGTETERYNGMSVLTSADCGSKENDAEDEKMLIKLECRCGGGREERLASK
jgi:hypothetical protein